MSLRSTNPFSLYGFDNEALDSGTSVLLTGDDSDALADAFAGLVTPVPEQDEQTVLLGTTDIDTVVRSVRSNDRDAVENVRTVTEPSQRVPGNTSVSEVDSIGDMTALGMHLSDEVGTATVDTDRFRAGVFLASDMCKAVDDLRDVYRFLNTSFLSELRRHDAVGACAVETTADIETDMGSMVSSMESSFDVHLELIDASRREATFEATEWDDVGDTVTVTR